jgi:hypothetical protein
LAPLETHCTALQSATELLWGFERGGVAYKAPSQLPLARAGWGDSQAQAVGLNEREQDERWGLVLIGQVALCICSKGGLKKSQAN